MEEYKEQEECAKGHFSQPLNTDLFAHKIEKLNSKIKQAHYTEDLEDWIELRKVLDKIIEKNSPEQAAAIINDNSVEMIIRAANDGLPNIDNFLTATVVYIIKVISEYSECSCVLLFRYELLQKIIEFIDDVSLKNTYVQILTIVEETARNISKRIERSTTDKTINDDFDDMRIGFAYMYNKLQDICFDPLKSNLYMFIYADFYSVLTILTDLCKFSVPEAEAIYQRYIEKVENYLVDRKAPEIPNIIKLFTKFMSKEGGFYNSFISNRKFKPFIDLIDVTTVTSIISLFEPLFKSADVVNLLAENDLIEILCELIQTPIVCVPEVLSAISKMTQVSEIVAQKVVELKLTSRTQLYRIGDAKQAKEMIKLLRALQTHGVDLNGEIESTYIPDLIDYCLGWDEYDTIETCLNLIAELKEKYEDFTLDIEDRLHEIQDNDDFDELSPLVDRVGELLYPIDSDSDGD